LIAAGAQIGIPTTATAAASINLTIDSGCQTLTSISTTTAASKTFARRII
jgi:hypothetical protein